MEREIPGGFVQVETTYKKKPAETDEVSTHLSMRPPLPGRVVDQPPEEDEDD